MDSHKHHDDHHAVQLGIRTMFSGTTLMTIGKAGPIQRQAVLQFKLFFVGEPDVSATVFVKVGEAPAFAVYQVNVSEPEGAYTQIEISAQNVNPTNLTEADYWCSYIVTGQLR